MSPRITEVHREAQRKLVEALSAEKSQSRANHLAWCKSRALEYAKAGDKANTLSSFMSDIGKWEHGPMYDRDLLLLMFQDMVHFHHSRDDYIRWVEGFN